MIDDNAHRTFWVIVVLVAIVVLKKYVITPSLEKVQAQKAGISNITYTEPATP